MADYDFDRDRQRYRTRGREDTSHYGRDDYRGWGAAGGGFDRSARYRDDDDSYGRYGSYGARTRGDTDRFDNRDDERRYAINETSRLISSEKVEGTRVYNYDGDRLGTIRNLMIEKRRGNVEYAVMSFGGFLGLGERYFPIPWQMLRYDEELDGYAVNLDPNRLDEAPSYSAGREPRFDSGYRNRVYNYYGVAY